MTPMDIVPFALLGAIVGLDVVSFPQAMVSRPLVAATLAGALAGDPERGLVLGAVLELVALGTLPFGASRYPDWGSASVVGGALYASGIATVPGSLALAVLGTLLAAWLSSQSMVWLRKLNAHWLRRSLPLITAGTGDRVIALQLRGLVADLTRGGLVTGLALAAFEPGYDVLTDQWGTRGHVERAFIAGLTSALGAATIWMLVRGTPGARLWILAGLAAGVGFIL
jgi:PTS system mannose-specific IIC component